MTIQQLWDVVLFALGMLCAWAIVSGFKSGQER